MVHYNDINFNGVKYRTLCVYWKRIGKYINFAENALSDVLYPNGNYINDYARHIDEQFYGYVNFNELKGLDDKQVIKYLEKTFS